MQMSELQMMEQHPGFTHQLCDKHIYLARLLYLFISVHIRPVQSVYVCMSELVCLVMLYSKV